MTASGEIGRARRRGRGGGRRGRRPRQRQQEEESEESESETGADPEVKKARAALKKKKEIARILKRAKARRRRIKNLKINQPLGWSRTVEKLKKALKADLDALRALGWKPKKPKKDSQANEDGEELDDEPEPTAEELEDSEEREEEPATEGDRRTYIDPSDPSWLDEEMFGAEAWRPFKAIREAGERMFGKPVPLGAGAIVKAKHGYRAVQLEIKPGLYLVTVASDAAVRKLKRVSGEGDVGFLPLVFAPKMLDAAKKVFAPHPAPGQGVAPAAQPSSPAQPAPAPAAAPATGCDGRPCTCRR